VFSPELAVRPASDDESSVASLIESSFANLLESHNCCAGFLCRWDEQTLTAEMLAAIGIPATPFKSTQLPLLTAFIQEALQQYAAAHVHSIPKDLLRVISGLVNTSDWQYRAFFIPGYAREIALVFICFLQKPNTLTITDEFMASLTEVISVVSFLLSASGATDRLKVMETYMREVGHDMASSVQSVIPKLRNIQTGLVQGPAVVVKLAEAEGEILSAYQLADSLGITVDPEYNIGAADYIDLKAAVTNVITLCRSEAAERHMHFEVRLPDSEIRAWGDARGVQIAIMHLILNAIKYGRGSSTITVLVSDTVNEVHVTVQSTGRPLDSDERLRMWDFGWRGERAKELHVNGSGIGLYTVKKIIHAHGGSVGTRDVQNPEVVSFYFSLPKKLPISGHFR